VTQTLPLLALLAAAPAATPTPAAPAAVASPAISPVTVKVQNPVSAARLAETVTVAIADLRKLAPSLEPGKLVVLDDKRKPLLSQLLDNDGDDTPDELVFQTDLGARESRSFSVETGPRGLPARDDFRVYGRFVRERHDDFAWENDAVAHRMYGIGLETWKKEPLTSSGIDVWSKKAKRLVINEWYMTDDYHRDNGEGGDFYTVKTSRGCGGTAIWAGDKPAVSRNFVTSRVLANGPIRLVFELEYAPFEAGGAGTKISETKRITLDGGKNFNRIASTFKVEGKPAPLNVGVGIGKHKGADLKTDKLWVRTWEANNDNNGNLGCAVILPPGTSGAIKSTDLDTFIVAKAHANVPFVYWMGSDWSKRAGGAGDAGAWTKAVQDAARDLGAPVKVTLSAKK
jgi:uncharacterized protein DUF4861